MSAQTAFQEGVAPLLQLLLPGKEAEVLALKADPKVQERIEELACKSTEGALSEEDREEYEGYIRANKFVAILRRQARHRAGVAEL
ncbi:MAG: hypothetical protein JWO08_1825 [Verrucomicrobiaceae bacterium]|nr:hypothetical protein [Verrucomicrobiaceae bacterium]